MSKRGSPPASTFGVRPRWDLTPNGILQRLQRWRCARRTRRERIPWPRWREATRRLPSIDHLTVPELVRLRQLAAQFLAEKVFSGAGGLSVSDSMRISIAAQACLLIVNMHEGLKPFRGWSEVIIYPDTFRVHREEMDNSGVVHVSDDELAGESWDHGPVVLSWSDIAGSRDDDDDDDDDAVIAGDLWGGVILHEFAHKLDALRGAATGMPPLPRHMARETWTEVFTTAYDALRADLDAGRETTLDPYAAEAPAEFFAVTTEYFFEDPETLRDAFPGVYAQLAGYFRQSPLGRHTTG